MTAVQIVLVLIVVGLSLLAFVWVMGLRCIREVFEEPGQESQNSSSMGERISFVLFTGLMLILLAFILLFGLGMLGAAMPM
jgi:hypothetical protein